jgi:sugar phosphate isomerase/epimerase
MKLGVSSHAFAWAIGVAGYPFPNTPMTALRLLERAVELDVQVIQIADNLPVHMLSAAELNDLRRSAAKGGIDIELGTCGIQPDHLRSYVELAKRLRSKMVRTLLDSPGSQPTATQVVDALSRVIPDFEQADVCLAIENHDRFPAEVLARMVAELGSPAVGICLDTANSLGCGEGLETVFDRLGQWVVNLHIKDFQAKRLDHQKGFIIQGCPAGQGQLNISQLVSKLRSVGRDPNAILELWVQPEPTIDETIDKEARWATESVRYLRPLISN